MLTALAILGVLAVLFLVTALATSDRQGLAPVAPDAADVDLPAGAVQADDVRGLRFGLAARGYRMSEVDAALERLAATLEERDRRLRELESAVAVPADAGRPLPDAVPEAPVVVPVVPVDPDAAGEAGAAAVDVQPVEDAPLTDAAFGQAVDLPVEGAAPASDEGPPVGTDASSSGDQPVLVDGDPAPRA